MTGKASEGPIQLRDGAASLLAWMQPSAPLRVVMADAGVRSAAHHVKAVQDVLVALSPDVLVVAFAQPDWRVAFGPLGAMGTFRAGLGGVAVFASLRVMERGTFRVLANDPDVCAWELHIPDLGRVAFACGNAGEGHLDKFRMHFDAAGHVTNVVCPPPLQSRLGVLSVPGVESARAWVLVLPPPF